MDMNETKKASHDFVVWQGYEYEHNEKTSDWYWMLGIISVAIAISAVFFGNYLFSVLIVVSAFSIAVHATQRPELKEFRVDENGIKIGKKFYHYRNIDSFFISEKTEPPRLFIDLKRPFIPLIIVLIGTANITAVKAILSANLKEEGHEIPFAQRLMDGLGF